MTRWDRSDDPIPEGHIRRSELFEAYYRMVTPNWEDLEKAIGAAHARRGSATNAPKRSAWKPAADGPLSKTEEDKFLRTLSKTEKAFLKTEKAFYAAIEARDDARADAATKFIAAKAAGELRPMIRKRGSNQVLSPNIWDKDDVIPLLLGLDGIIDRDRGYRVRPVFFEAGHAQSWLAKQAAAPAAPKVVGPDGGRPSSMTAIETELDRWIAGGIKLIPERMQYYAPARGDLRTKGRLALALSNFDGRRTASKTIQKTLSKKLDKALELII